MPKRGSSTPCRRGCKLYAETFSDARAQRATVRGQFRGARSTNPMRPTRAVRRSTHPEQESPETAHLQWRPCSSQSNFRARLREGGKSVHRVTRHSPRLGRNRVLIARRSSIAHTRASRAIARTSNVPALYRTAIVDRDSRGGQTMLFAWSECESGVLFFGMVCTARLVLGHVCRVSLDSAELESTSRLRTLIGSKRLVAGRTYFAPLSTEWRAR